MSEQRFRLCLQLHRCCFLLRITNKIISESKQRAAL